MATIPEPQITYPRGSIDKLSPPDPTGFEVGFEAVKLQHGDGMVEDALRRTVHKYPDYKNNILEYDEYITMWEPNRLRHQAAVDSGLFSLDNNDEVIEGENGFLGGLFLYDSDAIKGALLAKRNGFTHDEFRGTYERLTKERIAQLKHDKEGTSTLGYIGGELAAYMLQPETLIDFASPAKVFGSTVLSGAFKAFGVEALFAGAGESLRQQRISEHMERANLEYTLWDSIKSILVNSGFAGALRGIGSAVLDYNVIRKIDSNIPNTTDKEIFARWAQRENFKLTQNTTKHTSLMQKAHSDINDQKDVDISGQTDIDIEAKTDQSIESVSFKDEIAADEPLLNGEKKLRSQIEQIPPVKNDYSIDEPFEGMVDSEDGLILIRSDIDEFSSDFIIKEDAISLKRIDNNISKLEKEKRRLLSKEEP